MNHNEQKYISKLKQTVYDRISTEINSETIDYVVNNNLIKSHLEETASASFQNYYFLTLDNEKEFLISKDFFRHFKTRYSLQGIDNSFLDKLESRKNEILNSIRSDNLAQLYFDVFNKAEIKHGDGIKEKDLGSFFAKLVHTFRPSDYCALDNPIKNYFGLKRESFFLAFFIISTEYKHWATDNSHLVKTLMGRFKEADGKAILNHDQLTDLKLLDLIFWSKANGR